MDFRSRLKIIMNSGWSDNEIFEAIDELHNEYVPTDKMTIVLYNKSNNIVEKILSFENDENLEKEILNSTKEIINKNLKIQFLSHINALFLNVLLNRLNEFTNMKEIEKRVLNARKIICSEIERLRK